MAVEQQVFSLGSSRQSSCYELMDYKFAVVDEVCVLANAVISRVKAERANNQIAAEALKPSQQREESASLKSSARVSASRRLLLQGKTGWNQRYYSLLSKEPATDVLTVGSEASALFAEFRQAAEVLVSEIVAEMALDDAEKTLQPQTLDNDEFFATDGTQQYSALKPIMLKYQREGILVYLCSSDLSYSSSHEKRQNATSAAIFHRMVGHQVRAARALYEAIQEAYDENQLSVQDIVLQVPLQCTVDHLGFRAFVIASSQSTIRSTRQNLAAYTTPAHMSQLSSQLKTVFDNLGLHTDSLRGPIYDQQKSPEINQAVPTFFPVSAGFTVKTRNEAAAFEFQNLSDLIPAHVSSEEPDAIVHEVLLYKMRPEFVQLHGSNLPLHSNTHLPIDQDPSMEPGIASNSQLEAQLLQQSVISARECLHTVIIPEFVADLENATVQVIDSRSLTRALHGEGINVRCLASCYELASLKHIRRVLLAEMIARACKVELRASFRTILPDATTSILRQAKAPRYSEICESNDGEESHRNIDPATVRALAKLALQEEASQVAVEFFNLVLGISSQDSKAFWEERILPQVHAKFGLSREALNLDTIISEDLLHLPQLFHAIQYQTGICFSDHMNYNFKGTDPLALAHIQCISPNTVMLARTTTACEKFLNSSDTFLAAREFSSALSSIMFHISILETAPSDERNLSLCHLLTCAANISLAMNLREQAKKLPTLAIEDCPSNHAELTRAYTVLMKLKHAASDLAGAQEYFAKALEPIQWHLGPVHPLLCDTYMTMTEILADLGELEQAVEILQICVALVRDCFGKTSLLYADIRRQQGLLMYAANPKEGEAIIGVLEDAFSVYEKHFQDPVEDVPAYKDFAAECCYLLANLRTQVSGSQAAEAAYGIALTGLGLRKEVLPPNHEDIMKSYLQLGSLSRDLGEHYRAVDYYKPALSTLKTIHDDEHIDQIRSVTQAMLQLHLQTLSIEKRTIVDKTAKRYTQQWPRFALLTRRLLPEKTASPAGATSQDDDVGEESALLIYVMKKLFELEPIEYVDQLIEKTDLEFQDYRKQYNLNFAGTLRRTNADAPSPQHALLRSSSGRFASFSGAGTFSPPGSPRPLSPLHHPTLFPASPSRGRTSFNQLDCNFLKTANGDFTFGGQLAAVLFLMDLPAPAEPATSTTYLPQDVKRQTEALATKFRVQSLEQRADKLLQLSRRCDHQVLKLLLELAEAPTRATDEQVAVDLDAGSRWKAVLEREQKQQQDRKKMQDQLVDELFQISTNDEWYQAWDDSDDESDWGDMSDGASESEIGAATRQRNGKRSSEAMEEGEKDMAASLDSRVSSVLGDAMERQKFSEEEMIRDEILCRYYPEVSIQDEEDMMVDEVDYVTCALEKRSRVPFTLERPWLLCEAVVKNAEGGYIRNEIKPQRLIHEQTVVSMVFEALDGVDSLLFELHPVKPTPSLFSLDFQTKAVQRSRRSHSVAIGHLSPLAFQNVLNKFAQAASEMQLLRDLLGFIRQARDLSEQHRCVTLEGLANSLATIIGRLSHLIHDIEQQTTAAPGLKGEDSKPWSGTAPRQQTLLGIYGGLKEVFKMISWLKGVLVECFRGLSDRRWHEIRRAEQAKMVLDALYRMMELEYVEDVAADEFASTSDRLSRSDVQHQLFIGALNPYLDLINRMLFERGHFETIRLDGELFFATPASLSVGASPMRDRNLSFQEGLLSLAPFEVARPLVPIFLEPIIKLMNEALASRQMKNRFLQHQLHTAEISTTNPGQHQPSVRDLFTSALEATRASGTFLFPTTLTEGPTTTLEKPIPECVPFNRMLECCLTKHIENKVYVFNVFSERVIDHMQANPVAWADSEKLNAFHQSAVQGVFEENSLSNSQRQIGGRLCVRVDFNRLDSPSSGTKIDIATMKCMYFTFAAQQPLRVLFSASIMQKYSRLGVFLVQVKAVESALVKHATVIQYILTTFNHILRYVGQVDEFVSAVDRNMYKYFPDYSCGENDEESSHVNSRSLSKGSRSICLLNHSDFRILHAEMSKSSKEFKRQSHFLVVMLTAMQKHGASPHVNEIVTQLNYNYFYHQQELKSRSQIPVQQNVSEDRQAAPPFNRSVSLRPPPAPKKLSRTGSLYLA
ncbi:unnamed protein product [Phytophthora lilii]|uniref:Unnamed protein product n=1 Tax=Phytophthora lilii TaxID=2077276 RepID=A0A9W6TXI4_9STRA|nr:unnamed protein product [Phytophthora lilii]